mgnify:CR=1 FL=1
MFLIFKQFLSFIAINVILLFDIYLKIYADDNIESLYIFFSHFFIIIFIQFIIIYTVSKNILRQKEISKILLALFITLNIFVFKLANYQDINFLLESQLAQISIFFGLFITIFILYKFFHEKIIVIALIIFTPSALIQYSQSPILNKQANNENLIINSTEYPEFIQKPNVYLIGIDALAPFDVMNKSLSTNFDFNNINDEDILLFRNSFGFGTTGRTWLSMMFLGFEKYLRDKENVLAFSGHRKSVLFEIFKKNDYDIFTGIPIGWFGDKKGEFIDDYILIRGRNDFSGCMNRNKIIGIPKFYGLCSLVREDKKELYRSYYNLFELNPRKFDYRFEENIIKNIGQGNKPRLFAYHTVRTFHAESSLDYYDDEELSLFRNEYSKNFDYIKSFLLRFFNEIKKKDPKSIVLVFGDHGVTTFRSQWGQVNQQNSRDIFLDLYANQIFMLKTNNECSTTNLKYTSNYSFQFSVLLGLIDCLSESNLKFTETIRRESILKKESQFIFEDPLDFPQNKFSPKGLSNYFYE